VNLLTTLFFGAKLKPGTEEQLDKLYKLYGHSSRNKEIYLGTSSEDNPAAHYLGLRKTLKAGDMGERIEVPKLENLGPNDISTLDEAAARAGCELAEGPRWLILTYWD
jgi:hypothetical protein